jgi:transcriptional regulator
MVSAMYQPDVFRVEDVQQMHALMRVRPFAVFVSVGGNGLDVTHLPTVLKDAGQIECHVARANPHWKNLDADRDALMIFQGPEAYITPNWYPSKAEHGKVVPTWNYAVVHAHGRAKAVDDQEWLRRHVSELTAQQERSEHRPWATSDAPGSFINAMLRGIVGIQFSITRLEGKWKMNQNRGMEDRQGVVKGLRARDDGDDLAVAEIVSGL